jgi:uncharacterized protein (DUF169 family)
MNTTITDKNAEASRQLHEIMLLRYEPIAIKFIEDEADIPESAINPRGDLGKHMCLCQAYSLTRRNKKTVYMDSQSEWCWCPMVCMGYVDSAPGTASYDLLSRFIGIGDEEAAKKFFAHFPRLPYGKYKGLVTAPLCSCGFEPDIVLIYANPAQTRMMIGGIKSQTGRLVDTSLDVIDSCAYSTVTPFLNGEYRVTFPDPGEYERGLADEDEVILSVPGPRLDEFLTGLKGNNDHGFGYLQLNKEMMFDFPRPPFYNELFEQWGFDKGEDWEARK